MFAGKGFFCILYAENVNELKGVVIMDIVTTGDRSVIDALYEDGRILDIIACGGGNRNAETSGSAIWIVNQRLHHKARTVIGISSGAPTMAYMLGGGSMNDTYVFSDDTSGFKFFNPVRKVPADIEYLERVFRGEESGRRINAHGVLDNVTRYITLLVDSKTSEVIFFEPQTIEEVYEGATYACAMLGMTKEVRIRGRAVHDAAYTEQLLPVSWLMEQDPPPTDILVFAGNHHKENPVESSRLEQAFYNKNGSTVSLEVKNMLKSRNIRFMKAADEAMKRKDVRVLIIWIPEDVRAFGMSRKKALRMIHRGYKTMSELAKARGH